MFPSMISSSVFMHWRIRALPGKVFLQYERADVASVWSSPRRLSHIQHKRERAARECASASSWQSCPWTSLCIPGWQSKQGRIWRDEEPEKASQALAASQPPRNQYSQCSYTVTYIKPKHRFHFIWILIAGLLTGFSNVQLLADLAVNHHLCCLIHTRILQNCIRLHLPILPWIHSVFTLHNKMVCPQRQTVER